MSAPTPTPAAGSSILVGPLLEHFNCPVCLDVIQHSLVSGPCGHHFCEACIRECVNAKHECPLCKVPLIATQLFRDHQFDAIVAHIVGEQQRSKAARMDDLIFADGAALSPSPIEAVFRTHFAEPLAQFRAYFERLQKRLAADMTAAKIAAETTAAKTTAADATALATKIARLQRAHDDNVAKLVSSCEVFLQSHLTRPGLLPVSVNLQLPARGLSFAYELRAGDVVATLHGCLVSRLEAAGHAVAHIAAAQHPGPLFVVEQASGDPVPLAADVDVLLQIAATPLSVVNIHFVGDLVLTADLPKVCYASQPFDKEAPQAVDYFSCKTCNFNWICRACRDECHRGHVVAGHLLAHKPTWACCYCPKKKTCCLVRASTDTGAAAAAAAAAQ